MAKGKKSRNVWSPAIVKRFKAGLDKGTLTYQSIAEKLGITAQTAWAQLHKDRVSEWAKARKARTVKLAKARKVKAVSRKAKTNARKIAA